jgi:ABC-type iron transport system FetAB permease component
MCLIVGATAVGTALAVQVACRRLFDARERLRLDRLRVP